MLGAETYTNEILDGHSNLKPALSSMELCIEKSFSELANTSAEKTIAQDSKVDEEVTQSQSAGNSFQQSFTSSCDISSVSHVEKDLQASEEMHNSEMLKSIDVEQRDPQIDEAHLSEKEKEAMIVDTSMNDDDEKKSMR